MYFRVSNAYIDAWMQEKSIIIEDNNNENWDTYQPNAVLVQFTGYAQIRFTKKTADAVNIYKRNTNDQSWEFIATAVNSPYDDHDAEDDWEYCVRGIKDNKEIGIPILLPAISKNNISQ